MARIAFVLVLCVCAAWPATAGATPEFRGVNAHPLYISDAERERELDAARDLGANVIRVDVGWQLLEEQGKGRYTQWYLDRLDATVAGARERKMKVILMLFTTPCWASSAPEELKDGCSPDWWRRGVGSYPPTEPGDYARISAFLAGRYGEDLAAFEIWNEPNLPGFFTAPDPPAAYAQLVRHAYPAIKRASPGVRVLAGSLSENDRPFLESLYAHGIRGHYDALSVHPYNGDRDPYEVFDPRWRKSNFAPGLHWVREAQTAAGDATPIWATEFGWNTSSVRDEMPYSNGVDEDVQADYLTKAFALLAREDMSFVEAAVVYDLRDDGSNRDDPQHNYGLVRRDFSPKPAFHALRDVFMGTAPPPGQSASGEAPPAVEPSTSPAAAPSPPAQGPAVKLRARVARGRLTVSWRRGAGVPARRYRVYRRQGSGRWSRRPVAVTKTLRFVDRRARRGTSYAYHVVADYAAARPTRSATVVVPRRMTARLACAKAGRRTCPPGR